MSGVLVLATRSALAGAHRAGFGGVLETAVEEAIVNGRKFKADGLGHDLRLVDLGSVVAKVKKDGRTPQGRRRWVVLQVEQRRHGRALERGWAA